MDDLNVLRIFVAAAEAGSFATAGTKLGLTRSAVAKAVARLEQRTNTRLFHRTTRVVSLTDEGRALVERCRQTLAELECALDDLAGRRGEPRGVLRMTVPDAYGRLRVLPVLTRFLTEWPGLEADVSFTDRSVDVIAEGFDLAIHVGSMARSEELISRVVAHVRGNLCASPEYLSRHGEPRSVAELRRHTCLQFLQRGRRLPWLLRADNGEMMEVDIEARIRFDSSEALRDAAVRGLGIAQLPDFLTEGYLADGRLRRVLAGSEHDSVPIVAVYPTRKHLAPKVRLFIDRLVQAYRDAPVST
ncbi:DNA-binding transcriptional regulator, LysR family [Nannocystis exedens]|uniref:DNA-binding transcriptional regulator, LysR family n=1 Tax=Nannocystis exedens TaxID=54 RepID=A0A1I2IXX7_9BACT|nr:LysR family transcriptional regulator [Nannocystis exedens]PCC67212.1 LysR family transcriptional regulator [Nannocystis exedens]SFF47275.1 DNA-binding transcriptional regulator, LysR family [Nannocystis exedens]